MTSSAVIPAVVIGGAVYYLVKKDQVAVAGACPIINSPNRGTPLSMIGGCPPLLDGYSYDPYVDNRGQAGFAPRPTDPLVRTQTDLLQQQMEVAYQALDGAGRAAAAAQMNQRLNLDPPLRGDETWETVARVAGGAGGAAACAVVGLGAVGPLCAMAGSYLGVELEHWLAEADIGGTIKDTVNDIGGWIANLF